MALVWNPEQTPASRLKRLSFLMSDGSASSADILEYIRLSQQTGHPLPAQLLDPAYIQKLEQDVAQNPPAPDNRNKIMSSEEYFRSGAYIADAKRYEAASGKRTGFDNLDDVQKFNPGLYILGATTSLGKTTFIHQMAEQIASRGTYVLYFSLEQTTAELISKSLARKSYQMAGEPTFPNGPSAINNISQIITPQYASTFRRTYPEPSNPPTGAEMKPLVDRIISAYLQDVEDRLYIIPGQFGLTVEDIGRYVSSFVKQTGITPVVVVDYLQIIRPSEFGGRPLDGKAAVDHATSYLKQLQMEYDLILMVISSLNRQNYMLPIDQESFKESGNIEYSVDVLWGLQLSVIHTEEFMGSKGKPVTVAKQRELMREAKSATPRRLELVNLKNRHGPIGYTCYFDYYPAHDTFCEST